MNRPRCSVENSDANTYCRGCGQLLDPKLVALESAFAMRLDDRIKGVIDARFKDAKLLEVEVAEGVAKRLSEWGKIIAFFIGIPLVIVNTVLGVLGVKSYTDFSNALKQATDEQSAKIQAHGKELLQTLDEQLKKSPAIEQIQNEVNNLKTKFTILASPSMAATDKTKLDGELQKFQAYLMKVDFHANDDVAVRIEEEDGVCYYDPEGQHWKPEIFIQRNYANQTDVLLSEYARHVLMSVRLADMIVPPGKPNAPSMLSNYPAIGWGLTYYLVCCYRDRPIFWPSAPKSEWSVNLNKTGVAHPNNWIGLKESKNFLPLVRTQVVGNSVDLATCRLTYYDVGTEIDELETGATRAGFSQRLSSLSVQSALAPSAPVGVNTTRPKHTLPYAAFHKMLYQSRASR
jgi:hypothetical protein